MALDPQYRSLPFEEAIEFFRQKVRLPTRTWTDIHHGMHARAFVVSGATRDELLADIQQAIGKANEKGTTLEEFRRDFDRIVATYGWSYKGGRNWRSRVIYETNIRTAYMAGRYQQMTDPDVLRLRPYWLYKHGDSRVPRPMHLAWDGLTLKADDPWWRTHWPPNGWGCKCKVFSLSGRELKALGKDGPDTAPPLEIERKKLGRSPDAPVVEVPKGVDPGWGYNIGEAAWGRPIAQAQMDAWQAQGAGAFARLTPGDYLTAGRPERLVLDTPAAALGDRAASIEALRQTIRDAIGGEERAFEYPGRAGIINVDALALADHLPLDRARFVPWLAETITDPFEIWLAFEQHRGTGQVMLRHRLVKAFDQGGGRGVLVVAQATKGHMEAWTIVPTDDLSYLNRQRVGKLLYGR